MRHHVYFEGKVQSLGMNTRAGYATVGVITPGRYAVDTVRAERVLITSGDLWVKLPGEDWRLYSTNHSYVVPARCTVEFQADADVSYLCRYS